MKKGVSICGGVSICVGVVLLVVLLVVGEVVISSEVKKAVFDGLRHTTVESVTDDDFTELLTNPRTLTFFNLTNAYALQRETPTPKPIFELVTMELTFSEQFFDGQILDDGDSYSYKVWNHYAAVDEADWDREVVNVNPVYLGALQGLGLDESTLFAGFAGSVLQLIIDQLLTGIYYSVLMLYGMSATDAGAAAGTAALADFGASAPTYGDLSTYGDPAVCTPIQLGVYLNDDAGPLKTTVAGLLYSLSGGTLLVTDQTFDMDSTQANSFSTLAATTASGYSGATVLITQALAVNDAGTAYLTADAGSGDSTSALATLMAALDALGDTLTAYGIHGTWTGDLGLGYGVTTLCEGSYDGDGAYSVSDPFSAAVGLELCPLIGIAYSDYLYTQLMERFILGCNLIGSGQLGVDPLSAGAPALNPDGTGPANSGLFVRRTLRELWTGWDDPMVALFASTGALPSTFNTEYDGLAGKVYATKEALTAAIAAGNETVADHTLEKDSGKADIATVNQYRKYYGKGAATSADDVDEYPGWGTSGVPGTTFVYNGTQPLEQQSPAQSWPSGLDYTEPPGVLPVGTFCEGGVWEGCSVGFYLPDINRVLAIECEDDCSAWSELNGKVFAKKFSYTPALGALTENGVPSTSCAAEGACDFQMETPWVFDGSTARGAPVGTTLLYLGETNAAVRDAVTILGPDGSEMVYSKADDSPALYIDPLTGRTLAGKLALQNNFYLRKSMVSSSVYEAVFGADTDNDDFFVLPYVALSYTEGMTEKQATDYENLIYGSFFVAYVLSLVGVVLGVVLILAGAGCVAFGVMKGGGGGDGPVLKDGAKPAEPQV